MYEAVMWAQRFCKSYKLFVFTDHRNNTFRTKIQPSRRVSKKLLKMYIEMEPLGIERVYLAGSENILGDAPSQAPADRAVARNLPVPLAPIRETIHRLFWAPDELAGSTAERLKQLGVENPGVLTYLPQEFPPSTLAVNEALPGDETIDPSHTFCQQMAKKKKKLILEKFGKNFWTELPTNLEVLRKSLFRSRPLRRGQARAGMS